MNLDKLREQDDAVSAAVDSWPKSKLLRMFQVLKNSGITSDNIDARIIAEYKKENPE